LGVAETIGASLVTLVQKLEVDGESLKIQRVIPEGFQEVTCPTPAVLTVTNELGEARYPNLRGIMKASRKQPDTYSLTDLGLSEADLESKVKLEKLYIPESNKQVELIDGEDEAEAGRNLAVRLREEKLI
jgi:electron transfer flavoprotein beta subunit